MRARIEEEESLVNAAANEARREIRVRREEEARQRV